MARRRAKNSPRQGAMSGAGASSFNSLASSTTPPMSRYSGYGVISNPPYIQANNRFQTVLDFLMSWELTPAIMSCIRLIANSGAKLPIRALSPDGDEVFGPTKISTSHPLQRLLDRPNPVQSSFEFIYNCFMHPEISGNALIYLDNRDVNGVPDSIWTLPPERVKPHFDKDTGIFKGYAYSFSTGSQEPHLLSVDTVAHIKMPSPYSIYWGVGTVQALSKPANVDLALSEYTAQFFYQGASLSGLVTSKEALSDLDFERIKREVRNELLGNRNAHKIAVLDNGAMFTPLSMALKDIGIEQLKDLTLREILLGFGIPGTKLGLLEFAGYKSEEAAITFNEDVMEPRVRMVEDALNKIARMYDVDGNPVSEEEMYALQYGLPYTGNRRGLSIELMLPIKDYTRKRLAWAGQASTLQDLTLEERRRLIFSILGDLVQADKNPDLSTIPNFQTLDLQERKLEADIKLNQDKVKAQVTASENSLKASKNAAQANADKAQSQVNANTPQSKGAESGNDGTVNQYSKPR